MSLDIIGEEIRPEDVKAALPIPLHLQQKRKETIDDITSVIRGERERFLMIIGPCSADSREPVLEYVDRLSGLQEKVKDTTILIPRVYTNKPRTNGKGYKGLAHQVTPHSEVNLEKGLLAMRSLQLDVLSREMVAADEMLYPNNMVYVDDILGYHTIGARSSEDQFHRFTGSGIDEPLGIKNPTSGDLCVTMNSVYAAQQPHTFLYRNRPVRTSGNPYAHVILRGSNFEGTDYPNHDARSIRAVIQKYKESEIVNPAIIIDTNHSNSGKRWERQPSIARCVLELMAGHFEIRDHIKGLMVESYLHDGRINGIYQPGLSVTDPCIGWEKTEKLILDTHHYLADRIFR